MPDKLIIIILYQGFTQDYLEVVKMESDRHTYNTFQSINQQKMHSSSMVR